MSITCTICGKSVPDNTPTNYYHEGAVCSECEKNCVKCEDCGLLTNDPKNSGELVRGVSGEDGKNYCQTCFDQLYTQCSDCEDYYPIDDIRNVDIVGGDTRSLCESCLDNYGECGDCNRFDNSENMSTDHSGNVICSDCGDNYSSCDGCGEVYHNDYTHYCDQCEHTYCENCGCNCDNNEFDERNPEGEWKGEGGGYESSRLVGVEIEAEDGSNPEELADNLPSEVGITHDGSLDDTGVEVQTPRASGSELERLLKRATSELANFSYQATKSCGLHIHLDGRADFTRKVDGVTTIRGDKVSHLLRAYYAIEPMLYAMLPTSRFDNHYCQSIRSLYSYPLIRRCNPEKLEIIWYKDNDKGSRDNRKGNKYDSSRYCGVNLHSLFYRGSIEIRYHSGTTDYNKIRQWIRLNQAIIDYVAKRYKESEIVPLLKFTRRGEPNVEAIAKVLQIPDDLTVYIKERIAHFITTGGR